MLLDRCLGRLLRGGRPTELRGFLLLHQALDPDLEEVAAGARDYCRLLATPTTATGHLDPAELVIRLQQGADGGWEPWAYDLQQALLRLPREPNPATVARARRLPTPAGRRLAAWLADGGMPDPEVTRVVRMVRGRPRWLPDASQPVTDELVRVFATVAPGPGPAGPRALPTPLGIVHRLRPQRPPLAGLLCELAEPEHRGVWDLGEWLGCWPALLPSHRDVIAAHLQPRLTQLPWGARGDGQVLPVLAEADGPVGPGLTLGLANGLGARDPVDRAAAVDALVLLAGRRQLDGSTLGAEIASAIGGCHAIPELAAITGRGGSSRLVAESRRLQHLLA